MAVSAATLILVVGNTTGFSMEQLETSLANFMVWRFVNLTYCRGSLNKMQGTIKPLFLGGYVSRLSNHYQYFTILPVHWIVMSMAKIHLYNVCLIVRVSFLSRLWVA